MSETLTAASAEATTDPDGHHGRHRGGAAATEEPTNEAHGRHRRNDGDGGHHHG